MSVSASSASEPFKIVFVIVSALPSGMLGATPTDKLGASLTGDTVMLNVSAGSVVVPSETVKSKLSATVSKPSCT